MILRKGGRRVAKQGEVFQRCCRWFGLLFIRDCKRTFGVITSIMAATTTFLCGNKKIRAKGWLSSPLLRSFDLFQAILCLLDSENSHKLQHALVYSPFSEHANCKAAPEGTCANSLRPSQSAPCTFGNRGSQHTSSRRYRSSQHALIHIDSA